MASSKTKTMERSRRSLLAATVVLAALPALAEAEALKSPWDGSPIELRSVAYTCPAVPAFAHTLTIDSYYVDPSASIADPAKLAAFQRASEATTRLSQFATAAADTYREKGSREAAGCAYSLLSSAAKARAWSGKMPGFQGVYVQNWLLSAVAVAYLKVRHGGVGTPEQDAAIQAWLADVAAQVREYFDGEIARMGIQKENNHLYWAGLSLAAEGIADGDRSNFEWGMGSYRAGAHAVQPDGSLPQEMWRGQMAMHYHLYALAALVMVAELGEANGVDLYAEMDGAIHRLVRLCTEALDDPKVFERRTGVAQVVTLPCSGSDIGWAVPYVRRFPSAELTALIAKAPWVRYTTWGGAPPA